ncbi:MAG TPA: phosphate acyltransferase PlsX [Acidimicrobiales bacterium]
MTPGPLAPVALDAMGGDLAPDEIVAGARAAVDEFGIDVVLVGPPDLVGDTRGLELIACTEVIGMDEDPAQGVRRKKDSSLVRAAELVRDGAASATVSAGNTGATMAAALLRMGRIKGVSRPCIATPLPRPGSTPVVLVDAGANAECTPEMLVQFAQMASAYVSARFGVVEPLVGLLSIGEEPTKGTPLVKEVHQRLMDSASGVQFYGNVEGRDLIGAPVDVVVTDGFTGNVALKTLEGALRFMFDTLTAVIATDEATRAAGDVLLAHLLPVAVDLDPDAYGGAMLLGVDGVSVISHGSSSARAIKNALKVAHDLAQGGIVASLRAALGTT